MAYTTHTWTSHGINEHKCATRKTTITKYIRCDFIIFTIMFLPIARLGLGFFVTYDNYLEDMALHCANIFFNQTPSLSQCSFGIKKKWKIFILSSSYMK